MTMSHRGSNVLTVSHKAKNVITVSHNGKNGSVSELGDVMTMNHKGSHNSDVMTEGHKGSDVITASHKGSEVMTVSHAMTVSHRGRTAMIAQRERCHKTPKGSMSCQWATEELLMQQWRQQKGADMTHWQSTQWKDVAVTVNKWNYGIMMCQQSQWKGDDTVTGNRMKRRWCCNSQHKGKTMR